MGLIQRFRTAWQYTKQNEQMTGQNFLQGIMQRGEPPKRGTKELLDAYSKLPWLRATVSRVSTSVASVPWMIYVARDRNGKAVRAQKIQYADYRTRKKYMKTLKQAGEMEEILDHPLLDMLNHANPEMTGRTARQITQAYLDIKGESYWLIERNNFDMPVEFYPIPPHWILDIPQPERPTYRVSFQAWQGEIPSTEIIAFKDPDLLNPYGRGIGLAQAMGDELETDEYAAKHTKAWFYNRATPDILVGVEGATTESLQQAKAKWENEHRGFWKAFRSHWHSGNMKVHQLSQTFADQQLKDLREFERNTIIQIFGLPPEILGIIENSNRATIDSADYLMAKYVTLPRLELLRSELQMKLVPEFDEKIILEYENPVPEDDEFKLKVAEKAPWSRTKNEWRRLQGLEETENGDVYMVPVNLIEQRVIQPLEEVKPQQEGQKKEVTKRMDKEDVKSLLELLQPENLIQELDPEFQALVEEWGNKVLQELGVEVAFNMLNPLVKEHLREKSTYRIPDLINNTTREDLRKTLIEGVQEGEGIPQLAKRVSETFEQAKGYRATRIARTEVLQSSNFATQSAFEQSGVVEVREWLPTLDDRTRDSHIDMFNQQRKLTDPFTSGNGNTAMFPGSFGIASEDVNCRCTIIPVIDDPKGYSAEQKEALWKQFDRDLIPWEKRIERAAKRGFQKQQDAVMERLKEFGNAT